VINIAVLISGRGSNLQAIIDACAEGRIDGKIMIVISNKKNAYGLLRAQHAGIESLAVETEAEIIKALAKRKIDLVVLAGYMKIVSPELISRYRNRIMNIHPALLPAFPGLHGQKQAFEYGVKVAGATVHFVDEGLDTGPIILQKAIPVHQDDTLQSLSANILQEEHDLYSKAIQLFAQGRLKVEDRKVVILEE